MCMKILSHKGDIYNIYLISKIGNVFGVGVGI